MLHGMHGRRVQRLLRLVEAHSAAMRLLVEDVCSRLPCVCPEKLVDSHSSAYPEHSYVRVVRAPSILDLSLDRVPF